MAGAHLLLLMLTLTTLALTPPTTGSTPKPSLGATRVTPQSSPQGKAQRSTPNPSLLPNLKAPPLLGLAVPVDIWAAVAGILFPSAESIQIYWVQLSSKAHSARARVISGVFGHLGVSVVSSMGRELGFPYVLWTVTDGVVPPGARLYVDRHREDRLGEFSLVIAAYTEECDDRGDLSLRLLERLDLWFQRRVGQGLWAQGLSKSQLSYYIVLLDTWALPASRRCDEALALNVSLAVWRSSMTVVGVVLVRCPWSIVLHEPFALDPRRRRVVIRETNVADLKEVVGDRRYRNFHGWKWPVSSLAYPPHLVRAEDGTFAGVDGSVFMTAAKYFNFTAVNAVPPDAEPFGYSDDGKTGTGTLGKVMTGEAWISFNSRFRKDYNTKDIDFTYPYSFDELCVMVPQAQRIPNYITIFRIFRLEVWLVAAAAFLCTALATHLLDRAHAARRPRAFRHPGPCGLAYNAFLLILAGSTASSHSGARETSTRLLFGMALLFSLNFMGAYQGMLFKARWKQLSGFPVSKALTMPQYYPQIDSLKSLADSGIPITARSSSLKDTFKADNRIMKRLDNHFRIVQKNWTSKTSVSFLIRRNGAFLKDENKVLHLVAECPRKYMMAYIVHRNFPYLHQMNIFLMRCIDVGLMQKWFEDTFEGKPARPPADDLVLSLIEVEGAFFVLSIGVLASCLAFSAELLNRRCEGLSCRRSRPHHLPLSNTVLFPVRRYPVKGFFSDDGIFQTMGF
ncbi:Ionotropic receptor 21a [Frankliniella fusca]|uniref:Ionotropic receptor 21a n=1 Tax=Frankliniella fusca TaxID=407009 RepID=A0AAE1LNE3_9NEOP|nr:Ionotropic receptor 21a [Frankliniella fusca]